MATSSLLYIALAALMVDAAAEMSFVTSMVSWLHRRAGRSFSISFEGTDFPLHGKPAHLLVDQGHTSNGAAGTAFVIVGLGGIIVLLLRSRGSLGRSKSARLLYSTWVFFSILSTLLTLGALIFTFILTYNHDGQRINLNVASQLNDRPYPNQVPYPRDEWTPENWFAAILQLDLVNGSDRDEISKYMYLIRGWRWNLIPLFVLGLAVSILAIVDGRARRRRDTYPFRGSPKVGA